MSKHGLVPKQVTAKRADGTEYQTTVYVNPEDSSAGLFEAASVSMPKLAQEPFDVSKVLISPEVISRYEVEETTLRNNPALKFTFPDDPREVTFVADDGRGVLPRPDTAGIMFIITNGDDDSDLVSYEAGGQEMYGSPFVERGASESGFILAPGDDGEPVPLDDSAHQIGRTEGIDALQDMDQMYDYGFYPNYSASDGRPIVHHLLADALKEERVKGWMDRHAVSGS